MIIKMTPSRPRLTCPTPIPPEMEAYIDHGKIPPPPPPHNFFLIYIYIYWYIFALILAILFYKIIFCPLNNIIDYF